MGDVMPLTIMIILTWLICMIFIFIPKSLSFLQNLILFMVLTIIARNVMTILTMELQLIKTTQEPVVYLFFILQREVFMPVATLIAVNYINRFTNVSKKIVLFMVILASIHIVNYLANSLNVLTYENWNYLYSFIYEMIFISIALGLANILLRLSKKQRV